MKKITQHFKMSITKRKLIGMIFENKRVIKTKKFFNKKLEDISTVQKSSNKIIITSNKSEKLLINDSINNHSRNLNEDLGNHQNATIFKKTTEQKDKHSLFNSHNIMNSKLQISINEKGFNKNMEMNENFFYKPIKMRENPKNNLLVLEKKTKFIFPFYYFLLDALFDNLINPQRFCCISKNYFTVYNFMCQVYDISTHILLFKQFSLMNAILKQTKYEGSDLNKTLFFDKINIGDNMIMEKINNNLKTKKSIVNYDSVL
jgi:hypothetical protein